VDRLALLRLVLLLPILGEADQSNLLKPDKIKHISNEDTSDEHTSTDHVWSCQVLSGIVQVIDSKGVDDNSGDEEGECEEEVGCSHELWTEEETSF